MIVFTTPTFRLPIGCLCWCKLDLEFVVSLCLIILGAWSMTMRVIYFVVFDVQCADLFLCCVYVLLFFCIMCVKFYFVVEVAQLRNINHTRHLLKVNTAHHSQYIGAYLGVSSQ